jgi:hypothetical protein
LDLCIKSSGDVKMDNLDLNKVNTEDLSSLWAEMNATLARHTQYLEKHEATMQELSQAIKQLDNTIKKLVKKEEYSLQFREVINLFVEENINPFFYQSEEYTALPMPNKVKHHKLLPGEPQPPSN